MRIAKTINTNINPLGRGIFEKFHYLTYFERFSSPKPCRAFKMAVLQIRALPAGQARRAFYSRAFFFRHPDFS